MTHVQRPAVAIVALAALFAGAGRLLTIASQRPAPPPYPLQDVPPEAAAVLEAIKADDKELMAVSAEDGRFLRLTVASKGARRALEIGAADGYSAIWIGLGLRQQAEGSPRSNMIPRTRARQATTSAAPAWPTS